MRSTGLVKHLPPKTFCDSASGDTIMIGDREHDVIGAIRNNMRIIGVSYGYGTEEELRSAGAEQIVSSPDAIGALLLEWKH